MPTTARVTTIADNGSTALNETATTTQTTTQSSETAEYGEDVNTSANIESTSGSQLNVTLDNYKSLADFFSKYNSVDGECLCICVLIALCMFCKLCGHKMLVAGTEII